VKFSGSKEMLNEILNNLTFGVIRNNETPVANIFQL